MVHDCHGTALYAVQACTNHSCQPAVGATKGSGDADGAAVLRALRPIQAGEEVCATRRLGCLNVGSCPSHRHLVGGASPGNSSDPEPHTLKPYAMNPCTLNPCILDPMPIAACAQELCTAWGA